MSRHLNFGSLRSVAVVFVLLAVACGDDDSTPDAGASGGKGGDDDAAGSGGSSGGDAAGRGGSGGAGAGGRGGSGGTGGGSANPCQGSDREEGCQCQVAAECAMGLSCTRMAIAQQPIQICARPCQDPNECMTDEVCDSPYTGLARDAHCINIVNEPFKYCGVGETAGCGMDRICLYLPEYTIGVCLNFCTSDPSFDAGIPGITETCPDPAHKCITGLLDVDELGLCAMDAPPDTECGIEMGLICAGANICTSDSDEEDAVAYCREDCTATNTCARGGMCTPAGRFSYCVK